MDQIDKAILGYIMRDGPETISGLTQKIFSTDDKYTKHKQNVQLRYRLNKMVTNHVLEFDPRTHEFQLSKCLICDLSTLTLHGAPDSRDDDLHIETGPVICFQPPDGSLRIIFLEQDD